jgi:hypothetical protein
VSDLVVVLGPHPREGIEGNPATCIGAGQPAVIARGKWVCSSCGVPTVAEEPAAPEPQPRWTEKNYGEYLKTEIWRKRAGFARSRAGDRCWTCNIEDTLEIHHRTYERVGRESPDDLIALCSPCHTAVHLVADARRGVVRTKSKRARWAG